MNGQRLLLAPDGHVEQARAVDDDGGRVVQCPLNGVAQERGMVARQYLPESAVDVAWKVDDSRWAQVAKVNLGLVGLRLAGIDFLHRKIGV